eukprot:3777109-Rhodomonas_salina.3
MPPGPTAAANFQQQALAFGCSVSGFVAVGFRVVALGFRVVALGFRVVALGFEVWGCGYRVFQSCKRPGTAGQACQRPWAWAQGSQTWAASES